MKRWINFLLCLCLLMTMLPVSAAGAETTASVINKYKDVGTSKWYAPYVEYVVAKGLMTGTSDSTFAPEGSVTRAQYVQVLYALAGKPAGAKNSDFKDVKSGKWYTNAVNWAAYVGVTSGMTKTTFGTNQKVTREQAATFFKAYTEKVAKRDTSESKDISSFPDQTSVSKYAIPSMRWAVGAGLISGVKSGNKTLLAPKGTLTRAQLATMLKAFDLYLQVKSGAITRLQWIKMLLNAAGIDPKKADIASSTYNFTDVNGDDLLAVESALSYNALALSDYPDGLFKPNELATREFAAATAVNLIGYVNNMEPTCTDKAALTKSNEVGIAVHAGLIALKGGKFLPNDPIEKETASSLITKFKEIYCPRIVTPRTPKYTLKKGVLTLKENNYNAEPINGNLGYQISLEKTSANSLKKGKTVILPKSDRYPSGLAVTITSAPAEKNGKVIFQAVPATEEELFESYSFAGKEDVSTSDDLVFQPAENVDLISEEELEKSFEETLSIQSLERESSSGILQTHTSIGKDSAKVKAAISRTSDKKWEISAQIKIGEITAKGNVKINKCEVSSDVDNDEKYICADIEMDNTISILSSAGNSLKDMREKWDKNKNNSPFEVFLGQVDTGKGVILYLYLNIDLKASAELKYTVTGHVQASCGNGGVYYNGNFNKTKPQIDLQGKLEIGPELGIGVGLFGRVLFDVNVFYGIGVKGTDTIRTPDLQYQCVDLIVYTPLTLSVLKHSVVAKALFGLGANTTLEKKIFDDKTSEHRAAYHYEIRPDTGFKLKLEDECTWGKTSQSEEKDTEQEDPDHDEYPDPRLRTIGDILKNRTIKQVEAGQGVSYVLCTDGTAWQMGSCRTLVNDEVNVESMYASKLTDDVKALATLGNTVKAVIKNDGSLWMWQYSQIIYPEYLYDDVWRSRRWFDSRAAKIMDNVKSVCTNSVTGTTAVIKEDGSLWTLKIKYDSDNGMPTAEVSSDKIMSDVKCVTLGGYGFGAAVKTDGTLWYWGRGIGATPIKLMDNVNSVSAGLEYLVILKNDKTVWTRSLIGSNYSGELGQEETSFMGNDDTLSKIMDDVTYIRAGENFAGAITSDGTLYMWGCNEKGQVGDGQKTVIKPKHAAYTTTDVYKPTPVLKNVKMVSPGFEHCMAAGTDDSLYMWGDNSWGQYGNGTIESSLIPKKVG